MLPGSLGAGVGGGGCGGDGVGSQEAGAGPHFLLQIFFSYFPPLKPRCVLWSGASYSPKNTVVIRDVIYILPVYLMLYLKYFSILL